MAVEGGVGSPLGDKIVVADFYPGGAVDANGNHSNNISIRLTFYHLIIMITVFHLIRMQGRYTKHQGGVFISYLKIFFKFF